MLQLIITLKKLLQNIVSLSVPKMFQIKQKLCKGTKTVQENKKCAREQKCDSVAHYGIEWHVFLVGLLGSYVASYGLVAAFQGHGHVWPHST